MVFYFVAKELVRGSLLQRFVDGDDEFRNSRLKLIPSVPKVSFSLFQFIWSTYALKAFSVLTSNIILFHRANKFVINI